jgi:hypothetical protein
LAQNLDNMSEKNVIFNERYNKKLQWQILFACLCTCTTYSKILQH